ncbi:MAG TPA: S9 family peptidase, partial [Steroidobacteraceae bacterium]|nr:S9 family peptidase [Steroidobacteraceae bacterium]
MSDVQAKPPVAAAHPYAVESPHGSRNDEYYWLRDDERKNTEMLAYLTAENAYTDAMLAHTKPLQTTLYGEMIARIQQDDSSVPYRKRGYWYYRRYETGKEYPIYARKKGSLDAVEEVLLDANKMAAGHDYFQVGNYEVSPDNRLLAYAYDDVGRRQYRMRVRNLETGELLTDVIENIDPGLAWSGDSRTLVYVAKDPVTLLGDKVRKHALGADPKKDALVFEEKDKSFYTGVSTTKDEEYVCIFSESTVSTEMRVAKASDTALKFSVLIPRERDHEYHADHMPGRWIVRTNWQARNFRVVEASEKSVADRTRWRDLVAHRDNAFIDGFDVFRDFLAIGEHSNGLSNVRIQRWDGTKPSLIDSDEPAYAAELGTNVEIDTILVRYTYTSLTTPISTYDFDTQTGKKTLLKREAVLGGFEQSNYQTEHLWATARDGAKVPVSIVYRKGRKGPAPLLQQGCGAYGFSNDPSFSSSMISLLDRGFVFAIAHVRGGQEMGRDWYENGRLLHKRNSFTDFIDVTRYLVETKYADPNKTFAIGGSAGGLLMGAIANMAPQDYRGIIAQVPFVDAVTTMLDDSIPLTTNEYDEWGNPAEKKYYDYILSYSPYDNLKPQAYPALFVGTGLWDSQVQYYEPAKWVARLRKIKT